MKSMVCLFLLLMVFLKSLHGENVLLISVDTLRADRLSCYGYRLNRTPAMDRWATEGVRFDNAYSEYPLTLPAHSTLLTGVYPLYHGVRENVGFSLGSSQVLLAEIMKANGFVTAGFIGSYVLASEFGIARGFDTYDQEFDVPIEKAGAATSLRRPAGLVADSFLTWLSRRRAGRFFAFVHFYDPHAPCPQGYDREVMRVDRSIARIDDYLRKSNLLETTHIFLVSDHGESLGEHGESGHGFFLYDSTLRVPLIMRPAASFSYSQKVVKQAVSLADVLPTILQMEGWQVPSQVQGESLIRMMLEKGSRDNGLYAETYVPQLQFGWSPLRSYRRGPYLLINAPRPEFYNYVADPGQKVNLFSRNRALAAQYQAELEEFVRVHQTSSLKPATARPGVETLEKLAALGYAGLGSPQIRSGFGKGTDPKDRIGVFESYYEILSEITSRRASEGVLNRIRAIRQQAPELQGIPFLEAQALETLGRLQNARAKYQESLAIEPGNNLARAGFARLLVRLGSMDEAEREFQQLLTKDPSDYRSRNNLAGIYGMTGRTDAAMAELKRALDTRPSYGAGWQNLGQLYAGMQNWKEAERALRNAVKFDPTSAAAHFVLAQVLRAEGRTQEAEQQMRTALRLDPKLTRQTSGKNVNRP